MRTHADKSHDRIGHRSPGDGRRSRFQIVDNRAEAVQLRELQEMADASPRVQEAARAVAAIGARARREPKDVHRIAAAGVQGAGHRLPHHDTIQKAFGSHDIGHVQAYTGSVAADASRAISASAYTTGNKIAFSSASPSLRTAAHEAAHVIQQRAGVQLQGGIGAAGDRYERHADAVADAVVRGQSAEGLLDAQVGAPGARASEVATQRAPVVQREEIPWPEGGWSTARAGDEFYNSETQALKVDALASYPHITEEGKTALKEGKATGVAMKKANEASWTKTDDQHGIPLKYVAIHEDRKCVSVEMQEARGLIGAMDRFNRATGLHDAQEDDVRHVSTHPYAFGGMHRHSVVLPGGNAIDGGVLDTLATKLAEQGALVNRAQWEPMKKEKRKQVLDKETRGENVRQAAVTFKALFRRQLL